MATAGQPETGTTTMLVVAIDFGTTYSGYAYSVCAKPDQIFHNKAWADGMGKLMSLKTPTCVLLTPDKEFESFGNEAEEKYAELAEDKKHNEWYFFRRFKMVLFNKSSLTEKTMLPDISGKELPAVDIFAHSIRYLKDHLKNAVRNQFGEAPLDSGIQYVLTVPAIWDDKAKIFMRKAAVKAGIRGEQLRMAFESEAASLWCQMYAKETHVNISRKYIVVDLGGGTADITVQEQNDEDTLVELHPATGGSWGGNTVDNNFENMLSQICGKNAFARFKAENLGDYLYIMRSFEMSKRDLKGNLITVRMPYKLSIEQSTRRRIFLKQDRTSAINKRMKELGLTNCNAQNDKLRLDISVVRDLFRYPMNFLVHHLESLFKQDNFGGVDSILLVGGFAEASIVRERISEAFQDKKVIIPPEPELAVLKGAVRFGQFPRLIAARKSKFFYGLESCDAFDPNKHPENKRMSEYGRDFCCKIFSEIVAMGEDLPYGKQFLQKRIAVDVEQTTATESLYASTSPNTSFVDEEGCVEIGKILVLFPQSDNIDDKKCIVYLSFWDTEIKFRVEVKGSTDVYEKWFDRL